MSDIVDAGCHLLIWLGLLDAGSCTRFPESQSPLWLKMIAGPTLVITILILVLFEDMYVRPKIRLPLDMGSPQTAPRSRRRYQARRPGFFIQAESASDLGQPFLDRDKIRLVICDKMADQSEVCYRLLKSCPLKELVQYHYRSLGRDVADDDVSQYILHRQDVKSDPPDNTQKQRPARNEPLKLDKTPRQLSLQDLDRLELQVDYKSLCESYSNVLWRTRTRFFDEIESERVTNQDLTEQLRAVTEKLEQELSQQLLYRKTIQEQKLEISHLQEYRHAAKEAKANVAKIEVLYALESSSRSRLGKDILNLQNQLTEVRMKLQQNQRQFEQELSSKATLLDEMKLQLDAVTLDRDRLLQQVNALKVEKDKALKQQNAKKEELRVVNKQLCEAQGLNEKITIDLNELRTAVKILEATNSNLQLQLHEQRKDGEIRPGALICRPSTATKKAANSFESSPQASEWIRSASRSLPGIQAPLLIIDDGGKPGDDPRSFHPLESKATWR